MFWRWAHTFLIWLPPSATATYLAVLGIAANAVRSDTAQKWFDGQVVMWGAIMLAPYGMFWLVALVAIWLAAFIWTGQRGEAYQRENRPGPPAIQERKQAQAPWHGQRLQDGPRNAAILKKLHTPMPIIEALQRGILGEDEGQPEKTTGRRRLSEPQRSRITAEVRGCRPPDRFEVVYHSASEEAARYASQITAALEGGGWDVICTTMLQDRHSHRGLWLEYDTAALPPNYMDALARGLDGAGIEYGRAPDAYGRNRLYVDLQEDDDG